MGGVKYINPNKKGGVAAAWAKVKFDRQIVAIAKVFKVSMIYSDDGDVRALAKPERIPVTRLEELPVRPATPQTEMQLVPRKEQTDLLSQLDVRSDLGEQPDDESTDDEPI
jgi:hypothetical protein